MLFGLSGFALCALMPLSQAQQKKAAGKGIEAATVTAYMDLGATYGGFETNGETSSFAGGAPDLKRMQPGFFFPRMPKGKLPPVDVPFALGFGSVKGAELKQLVGLKNLTALYLGRSGVTDLGLKALPGLKDLTTLELAQTKVTAKGMKDLARCEKLTILVLNNTEVTDAGLKELAELKNLTTLGVSSTKVTEKGAEALRKALPKCKIIY
jgi:hypothetical protein